MSVERGADADADEGDAEAEAAADAVCAELESGADVAESAAACASVSFLKRLAMVSSDEEDEEEEVAEDAEEEEEDSAESDAAEAVRVAAGVEPSAPSAPLSSSLLRFMFSSERCDLPSVSCALTRTETGRGPAGDIGATTCDPKAQLPCFHPAPPGPASSISASDVILTATKTDSNSPSSAIEKHDRDLI
jgi:hypothetical protein